MKTGRKLRRRAFFASASSKMGWSSMPVSEGVTVSEGGSSGVIGARRSSMAAARLSEEKAAEGESGSDCDGVMKEAFPVLQTELDLAAPPDERSDLREAFGDEKRLSLGLVVESWKAEVSLWLEALRPIFLRKPPHLPPPVACGSASSAYESLVTRSSYPVVDRE